MANTKEDDNLKISVFLYFTVKIIGKKANFSHFFVCLCLKGIENGIGDPSPSVFLKEDRIGGAQVNIFFFALTPLSPIIFIQTLQTDLHTFPCRIS